jgi:hypothetical protein
MTGSRAFPVATDVQLLDKILEAFQNCEDCKNKVKSRFTRAELRRTTDQASLYNVQTEPDNI